MKALVFVGAYIPAVRSIELLRVERTPEGAILVGAPTVLAETDFDTRDAWREAITTSVDGAALVARDPLVVYAQLDGLTVRGCLNPTTFQVPAAGDSAQDAYDAFVHLVTADGFDPMVWFERRIV